MMNEWGIPTVYVEVSCTNIWATSKSRASLSRLRHRRRPVPGRPCFQRLALGAPYTKLVCMGRSIMTAAMVNNEGRKLEQVCSGNNGTQRGLPEHLAKPPGAPGIPLGKYGRIPAGAIGMYSYLSRMTQGLQQFMAGARNFNLNAISRNDLVALTEEAAKVSGIPYVMDADAVEAEKILGYRR